MNVLLIIIFIIIILLIFNLNNTISRVKSNILLLIIIFIITQILNYNIEKMTNIIPFLKTETPIPDTIIPYTPDTPIPVINLNNNIQQTCLVEKKYLPDNTNFNGGDFKYVYTKNKLGDILNYPTFNNSKLLIDKVNNRSNYPTDNNSELLIDKINGWSNDNCSENKSMLGSCRIIAGECVDFVNKNFCDKYKDMIWSKKTCNNQLK